MLPARWSLLLWVAYVVAAAGSNALLCLNPSIVWMATQVTIDANPIPLLRVIIAKERGRKTRMLVGCTLVQNGRSYKRHNNHNF
jgi:hypothetical protein